MSKVLVIAFDGMDKDLIERYGLENIRQIEYGTIDNKTGVDCVKTSELFTSFITGKDWKEHGITGLKKGEYHSKLKENLINFLVPKSLLHNRRGAVFLRDVLETSLRAKKVTQRYTKEDIDVTTLFEQIDNSRPLFVPGYNPGMIWRLSSGLEPLRYGYTAERTAQYWDRRSYSVRKKTLFDELENDFVPARDFLMCHFHRADIYHHLYADVSKGHDINHNKLRKIYSELDELAGQIKDKATEKGYDYVIFMSDHGLPTEKEHNENAFYSCNKELFGEETPHITDFHDKILELTGNEGKIDS